MLMLIALPPMIASAQTIDDCLACHENKTLTTERNGKVISLFVDRAVQIKSPHAKLILLACHIGFDAQNLPHKDKIEPVNCFACHKDAGTRRHFMSCFESERPGGGTYRACKQCHGTHNVVAVRAKDSKHTGVNLIEMCGACHRRRKKHLLRQRMGKRSLGTLQVHRIVLHALKSDLENFCRR